MTTDELRARFLRDKVMTATPAQRVVMLYDRLGLDLTRADDNRSDPAGYGIHLSHAMQVVTELQTSLDLSVGGPAQNLASIYTFLLTEIIAIRGGQLDKLAGVREIVATLREAWAKAAEETVFDSTAARSTAGAWVS